MEIKHLKTITKSLLLIGIICCIAAHFFPWGEISIDLMGNKMNLSFYHNGVLFFDTPEESKIMFIPTDFSDISGSLGLYGYAAATMLLYFIFPCSLIGVIAGIVGFTKLGKKQSKNPLHAALLSLLAIVLFVIFIYLGILSNIGVMSSFYQWSIGIYLMVLASLLFLGAYGMQKRYYSKQPLGQPNKK